MSMEGSLQERAALCMLSKLSSADAQDLPELIKYLTQNAVGEAALEAVKVRKLSAQAVALHTACCSRLSAALSFPLRCWVCPSRRSHRLFRSITPGRSCVLHARLPY